MASERLMAGLTRYLGRLVLVRLAAVLIGVLALGLTFNLLEAGAGRLRLFLRAA